MMYGKHFAKMYEGSMVGAGSHVFAVMGYVIAKQVPDRKYGSVVFLNPTLLASVLGDTEDRMQEAITFLCSPDPRSYTPTNDGRRLVQLGPFDYQVVNGAMYRQVRNEEERKEQNREAQRRHRGAPKPRKLAPGEQALNNAAGRDDERGMELAQATQEQRIDDLQEQALTRALQAD